MLRAELELLLEQLLCPSAAPIPSEPTPLHPSFQGWSGVEFRSGSFRFQEDPALLGVVYLRQMHPKCTQKCLSRPCHSSMTEQSRRTMEKCHKIPAST